ncbi:MAG: hypothetical protein J6P02_04905 [Lachnospiraceae bacterium]|nr:hypothetical protein [Lachnospiraceae bacterium]
MRKRKITLFVSMIIFSLMMSTFVSNAGIIDDILKGFGIKTEESVGNDAKEAVENIIEESLDEDQKAVIKQIENIYMGITNLDLDLVLDNIDYELPEEIRNNIQDFFDNYHDGKDNVKGILKTVKYNIESVSSVQDKMVAKITYSYPEVTKVIKKVLPEIIIKNPTLLLAMKNPTALFLPGLNNDILSSIFEIVKNELDKNSYETETYTRDFNFKLIDGKWKLTDTESIVKDFNMYLNNLPKS